MLSWGCRFQGKENIHPGAGRGGGFLFFGLKAFGGRLHLVFLLFGRDGEGKFPAAISYRFAGFRLLSIAADFDEFDLHARDGETRFPEHGSRDDGRKLLFLFLRLLAAGKDYRRQERRKERASS